MEPTAATEQKAAMVRTANSSTYRHHNDQKSRLAAFAAGRLSQARISAPIRDASKTIVDLLASSILTTNEEWLRRPSISTDGNSTLVSLKFSKKRNDSIRLLVEPGHLAMTVAQQIAFSLQTLDRALELLSWRTAAQDINNILKVVLPANSQSTTNWWGGMWMGAARLDSKPEVRIYLNLRYGTVAERWNRVSTLLRVFFGYQYEDNEIQFWYERLADESPVGLGLVIRDGQVTAVRIYVSVQYHRSRLTDFYAPISDHAASTLVAACQEFHHQFGEPSTQRLTMGFDFVRKPEGGMNLAIGRVKVELCCQMIEPSRQPELLNWIKHRIDLWSLDGSALVEFLSDINSNWRNKQFDFVSLGFTPEPNHVTVYVKPWS